MTARELRERISENAHRVMRSRGTYPAELARDRGLADHRLRQWLRPDTGCSLAAVLHLAEALEVDPVELFRPLAPVRRGLVDGRKRKSP